ncbi:MAG TPA: DUF5666 domain-containing protein [Candidatus Paceibacterota bacterium]|nr:DUF5666 domain-containing protein [Candidatus Paceibacterota bacterium]
MFKTKVLLVSAAALALMPLATFAQGIDAAAHVHVGGRFGYFRHGIARGIHSLKNAVVGTVSAVNGNGSFTVTKKDGSAVTVTTDASTKVNDHGTTASASAITLNDKVVAGGTWNDAKTSLAALRVRIVDNIVSPVADFWKNLFAAHAVVGTITAINGNVITIVNKDNATFTSDISSAKLVKKNGLDNASIADFKVNDKVEVLGSVSGSVVTAQVAHDLTN